MNYLSNGDVLLITVAVLICLYIMLSDDNDTPSAG